MSSRFGRVAGALALMIAVGGCDSGTSSTVDRNDTGRAGQPDETLVPPEATLPGGRETAEYVAERLVRAVQGRLGIEFTAGAAKCLDDTLASSLDDADLDAIDVADDLVTAPADLQAKVFGVFDGCLDPATVGLVGESVLVASGATEAQSGCVFRTRRELLGIGGMYRFAAGIDGELEPPDPALPPLIDESFSRCGLDPQSYVTTTLPPETTPAPTPPTTTQPGASTTTTEPKPPVTLDQAGASSLPAPPPFATTVPAVPASDGRTTEPAATAP